MKKAAALVTVLLLLVLSSSAFGVTHCLTFTGATLFGNMQCDLSATAGHRLVMFGLTSSMTPVPIFSSTPAVPWVQRVSQVLLWAGSQTRYVVVGDTVATATGTVTCKFDTNGGSSLNWWAVICLDIGVWSGVDVVSGANGSSGHATVSMTTKGAGDFLLAFNYQGGGNTSFDTGYTMEVTDNVWSGAGVAYKTSGAAGLQSVTVNPTSTWWGIVFLAYCNAPCGVLPMHSGIF